MNSPVPNAGRLSRDLREMIATPSINPFDEPPRAGFREAEMGEFLLGKLNGLGLETGREDVAPGRPNVWGTLKGRSDGPSVMLAAHMDTVGIEDYPDALVPRVADGRIFGRGACDMKGAIACYLECMRMLQSVEGQPIGDVTLAFFSDEEDRMIGSAAFGQSGPKADFGIIGEPTGLQVCPAHKGQLCVTFRTKGKAAHSSGPEYGINAVEHMGRVITHFSALNGEIQRSGPRHPLCGTGRFSMNVVRGGTIASAIPATCELEVDRRFLPGEDPDEILNDLRSRLMRLGAEWPELNVSVSEPTLLVYPLDVQSASPVVRALEQSIMDVTGKPAAVSAFPGGSDAPNLGFPVVVCGPGNLEQAHSSNEHIGVSELGNASSIYFRTISLLQSVQDK